MVALVPGSRSYLKIMHPITTSEDTKYINLYPEKTKEGITTSVDLVLSTITLNLRSVGVLVRIGPRLVSSVP